LKQQIDDEIAFCTLQDECPYIEGRECKMEYKFIKNCSFHLNNELVLRGWRRFGAYFSRPICSACHECLGLRILTKDFVFSKSNRRVFKKNLDTQIVLKRPQISNEHLYLYDKYHEAMMFKKGWKFHRLSFRQYYNLYVAGANNFGYELDFYIDGKLVCVDLIDILKDGISSIYCFYDPDYNHLSLGKFSLLNEIKIAKMKKLSYIYLGYFVKNSQSLSYKADYSPNEILRRTSNVDESAYLWEKDDANRSKS